MLEQRTHTVGTVLSFNSATRRARISVDILAIVRDEAAETPPGQPQATTVREAVILDSVPVHFDEGDQGGVTFPVATGTKVELHVQDRSIDRWLQQAGAQGAPAALWTHALADAVAYPTTIHAPDPVDMTATVVKAAALIKLGAAAASPLVKGEQLQAALTAYTSAVSAAGATHASVVPPTAITNGIFITALVAATATLAGSIAGLVSTKAVTE